MRRTFTPTPQGISTYVESKEFFGSPLGFESILRLVKHFNVPDALVVLSKAGWLLEDNRIIDIQTQLDLSKQLLPDVRQQRAKELISQGRTIFFPPQIRTLMKFFILHGQHEKESKPIQKNDLERLGLALLATTDFIASEYRNWRRNHKDDDLLSFVTQEIISTTYLMHSPNLYLNFVRAKLLYMDTHSNFKGSNHPDFVDISHEFQNATDINLNDYISVGLGVIRYYLNYRGENNPPSDQNFILFDPMTWFKNSEVEISEIKKVIDCLSTTITEFHELVENENKRELSHDFLCMKSKPLLQVIENIYIPFSFDFLYEKLTTGIYWILFDYLKKTKGTNEALKFSRYNGIIFQQYVERIIQENHKRQTQNNENLLTDQSYRIGKKRFDTPDIMLFGEDYAILIEASATRLQAKRTTSLGLPIAFKEDCEKMIFHNAKSLDTYIKHFKRKDLSFEGITPDNIKKYFPVVIIIEDFPKFFVIENFLQRELDQRDLLVDDDIAPLSLLSATDIESLESICELTLFEALQTWHANPEFKNITLSQCLESIPDNKGNPNSWIHKEANELLIQAGISLFGDDAFKGRDN